MAEIAKLGQGAEALAATAKFDLQMNDDLGKSKDQGFSNILMIKREQIQPKIAVTNQAQNKDSINNNCLLMNTDDRYQPYCYTFESDKIMFKRPSDSALNEDPRPIVYDLAKIQVCTLDMSKDDKNYCKSKRHFALNIIQQKKRKVYFTQYEDMQQCLSKILELQGFDISRRFLQYKLMEKV